jgi:hypothetical protein
MSDEERNELQSAILTICDPRGNWQYGWASVCRLASLDPTRYPAPFRERTEEQLRELGKGTWGPAISRIQPPKEE